MKPLPHLLPRLVEPAKRHRIKTEATKWVVDDFEEIHPVNHSISSPHPLGLHRSSIEDVSTSVLTMTYISKAIPAQRKKLIICCDGTWQSSTTLDPANETPSNVSRLCRVLASAGTGLDEIEGKENEWQQIVYYDAGVGTGDISSLEKKIQGGSMRATKGCPCASRPRQLTSPPPFAFYQIRKPRTRSTRERHRGLQLYRQQLYAGR